jgi:hypothetical protein
MYVSSDIQQGIARAQEQYYITLPWKTSNILFMFNSCKKMNINNILIYCNIEQFLTKHFVASYKI